MWGREMTVWQRNDDEGDHDPPTDAATSKQTVAFPEIKLERRAPTVKGCCNWTNGYG
jgi:hypothetical protein